MKVEIIERKTNNHCVTLRHVGPYGEPISVFWPKRRFIPGWLQVDCFSSRGYGISHDDPNVTAAELCRYDAGCEIPLNFIALGNAHKTVIPGGNYAALSFKGTVREFRARMDFSIARLASFQRTATR